MRRTLMAFAAVFLLLATSLSAVAAQDATPRAQPGAAGGGMVPVGTAVTVVDNNDEPAATITVDKVEDPFKGYDSSSAPKRGFHFVALDVSVFAVGSAPFTGEGYFSAVDADGFSYQQAYVYVPNSDSQPEDFSSLSVDPGKVSKAVVYFEVLNNTKLGSVIYQPDYQRWITVLNLNPNPVKPGATVSFVDADGQPTADITVKEVIDPLKDFDPSSPPQRGFEYAAIDVSVKNTGSAAFEINPSDFTAVDVDGFAAIDASVYRTKDATTAKPDLEYGASIDPGKSVTGIVSFQVLKGSKINQVFYAPNDRFVEVLNLGGKGVQTTATPGPQASPVASGAGNASDAGNGSDSGNASEVATPDVTGVDCDAVIKWANIAIVGTLPVFSQVTADTATWQASPNSPIDTAKVRADAKLLNDTLDSIDGIDVPDHVGPLSDAYKGILKSFADDLTKLAADLDAKDTTAVKADLDAIGKVADAFNDPSISALGDALGSACPNLENLGS